MSEKKKPKKQEPNTHQKSARIQQPQSGMIKKNAQKIYCLIYLIFPLASREMGTRDGTGQQ